MISVYRDDDQGLQPADGFPAGAWIHAEAPTEAELAQLRDVLGVPATFLAAAVDPREVARTDTQRGIHLTIVRVPFDFGRRARAPYRTAPLGMIVTAEHFLTISPRPIDFVHGLTDTFAQHSMHTRRANAMILAILGIVGQWFLRDLEDIDRRMDDVEDRLADSIENHEMMELLRYEKSLVYLKTGLEWNQQMVGHLQEQSHFQWTEEDRELLRDVAIEYRQGSHVAATMQAVSSEMTETFASLISNNLSVVMKFLAAITIVLTVPMIFSSFYGMNVALPGQGTRVGFVVLLLLSLIPTVVVAWWFWRQGWLSFRWQTNRDDGPPEKEGPRP